MNMPYSAFWQLVHDTIRDMPDHTVGDLALVDTIVDRHMPDLLIAFLDRDKFTEAIKSLLNKYRGSKYGPRR